MGPSRRTKCPSGFFESAGQLSMTTTIRIPCSAADCFVWIRTAGICLASGANRALLEFFWSLGSSTPQKGRHLRLTMPTTLPVMTFLAPVSPDVSASLA